MGANEKHAATYHGREYTPDADGLRDLWVDSKLDHLPRTAGIPLVPTVQAAFDGWLETVRAEAKAEALNESATYAVEWVGIVGDGALVDLKTESEYADTAEWLRARANQYKEEQ